jgi:endoglycosylceramidase
LAVGLAGLVSAPAAADTPPTPTTPPAALAPGVGSQTSTPSDIADEAGVIGSPWDPRSISAPGGRFLRDDTGRVVILHGVNAVYKHAPYELAIAPGQPFDFSSADAAATAGAGFNMVRLGILWEGIEPGGTPNDPDVCTTGTPRDPTRFSARVADAYLQRVVGVVDLLATYHIHTLIDMHQDVYAEAFRGEGAPPWAVCTDDAPIVPLAGRWSSNYASATLDIAEDHFWQNNVVGNLQGEYDQVWATVAATFRDNPWVVGYDPYNEPFSPEAEIVPGSNPPTDVSSAIECFYTGRLHPGLMPGTHTPLRCPATDPALGVVPTIEAADPNHLVFVEPDIYNADGASESLGPMPFPRLVYNVHLYCGHRDPVTGDPLAPAACAAHEATHLSVADSERDLLATAEQPGGPPMFLSEFGATENPAVLRSVTDEAAKLQFGWTYWAWKYYDDPTGSSDEPLATADNRLLPQAALLAVPYAEAIAGVPTDTEYDPDTQIFTLSYVPDPSVHAPSVIMTTPARYPGGYCATASGATIVSPAGASHLLLENLPGSTSVSVHLNPGTCPPTAGP